ncbi:G-type lectin S-receptor-like serine/threonine-protein kinase At4g27290 [Salvia hispanica]|uniref:G-type lectin S-receptor-like serine/threonine-protein kinase At4g27290 n=1 Tax=Salvia hispanica TaxID=49212 RepID=UPI002009829B|nr:G-type lectin S-receptor-like serine/threonine-protein kinase At4g27290 [Salvia hispanica]
MDQQLFTKLLFCFLTIFKLCIAAQSDHTLSPNQTLVDGQLLISSSKIFELGFSSPANNTRRFLVIRYRNTPDVFVWLANRETPLTGRQGRLTLTNNGSLILTSPHLTTTLWIPSSDATVSSPTLQLLDSGNLVLTGDKQGTYLWQSFDYPCNTRLPGMTMTVDRAKYLTSWRSSNDPFPGEYSYGISNEGLSQIVVAKGKKKTYRTVFWNNEFVGFPNLGERAWMTEATSRKGRLVSVTNPIDDPGITRITLNPGGMVERFMMNERRDGWTSMLASPRDSCEVYGKCGGNGICKVYMTPICECLKGFRPRAETE